MRASLLRAATLALALSLGTRAASAAVLPEPWLEFKAPSARVIVLTDAGDKTGRRVAFQIVQFERALGRRFPALRVDQAPPVTVFASVDENVVRSLAPDTPDPDAGSSSWLVTSTEAAAAIRADTPDPGDKDRTDRRGYQRGRLAALLEAALGKPSPWLSRGLITLFTDTVVRDKEALTGRGLVAEGASAPQPVPSAAEFFRDGRATDAKFDTQAALFIHFLLTADGGRNGVALDALMQKLAARDAAGAQAAQAKLVALYAAFPKYAAGRKFPPLKLPLDPGVTAAALGVRTPAPAEVLMRRAEILFDLNRPVDTRNLLRLAKEADPKLARPLEIEAVLYEREQRTSESRAAIEEAIRLGSKNGSLYYRLAQLQWTRSMAKPALTQVAQLLETARSLSPGDAAVLTYLAEVQGDLGSSAPALENAQAAVSAAPNDLSALMALARAQWNARQIDAALATAQKAQPLAKVASLRQRVQDFLNFATANRRAQASGGKPYLSQFGPPPAGAFGVTRGAAAPGAGGRMAAGQARIDSGDASAIADCFANRNDAACSRAVPALETSCADRQTASCVSLGSLYEGGFGVTRDRRKAAGFYKNACDLKDQAGCARYAFLEAVGLGVPLNEARATKTLETLCAAKVPEGCVGLAQVLRRTGYAVDRERANEILKATCDAGSAEACGLLNAR